MSFLLKRLTQKSIWHRILLERLCEPLHLNIMSVFVLIFGSFRSKVSFDLVLRHHHAFGLLKAADWAKQCGVDRISALEFGVANGAGLVNMQRVAEKVTRETGVEFEVSGFDSGRGMPEPRDYRDHPEYYHAGDFVMQDVKGLKQTSGAEIFLGNINDTLAEYVPGTSCPIGFVSLDVDYFSSSVDALKIFLERDATKFLPWVVLYLDDVELDGHNPFCGELAAVEHFNSQDPYRKITRFNLLRQKRIFQRPPWIDHMYLVHFFDHPYRFRQQGRRGEAILDNPYLD